MHIFPDTRKSRVIFASSAEEQFYERCLYTFKGPWRIYYSCNLASIDRETGARENEIDFVLYHPQYGIFVVEVKGGRISYQADRGEFYSVNRHGESFAIKDPFKQVLVWKSRFVRYLKSQSVKAPVSHLVCFPGVEASEFPTSARIERQLIIGRTEMGDLEAALMRIGKLSHPPAFLNFADVSRQLDDTLVGKTFTSRLYLRDYIDSHELRVQDLEAVYDSFVSPIAGQKRLGIEGEAGTGKTMLALFVAKHFRDLGQRVLLLSSNPVLNLLLQQEAGEGIEVDTYTGIGERFGVNLLSPPADYQGNRNDWVQIEAPVLLKEIITQERGTRVYDVLICDEAQDVQPFWWEGFQELLASDESRLYLFFDRSQGIFGSGGESRFDPSTALPVAPPFFPLIHNYRTTREIATFARAFRTGDSVLQSHCGRLGYVPELLYYKDAEDCRGLLARLLRQLVRDEQLRPDEFTLLSARDPASVGSVLADTTELAKLPLHRLVFQKRRKWKETRPPQGHIPVSTIAAFKGLETKVGILVNVSEYNLPLTNPIMASLLYVACTRAKHMLYICVREDDPKRELLEKALSDIAVKGSMVLQGSDKDFEFIGTVSHYNRERVGWLAVEDPAFQKTSIMFFPHDVRKAGLGDDLKPGTKLKFRPRLEGHITIACDLKKLQER